MAPRYRLFVRSTASGTGQGDVYAQREALVFGTYKPSATTAGLLNDPTRPMTTINGNVTIGTGQTVENRTINGLVTFTGANGVLRNCHVRGDGTTTTSNGMISCTGSGVNNALIEDCTVDPQTPSEFFDAIKGHDYTARRVRTRRTTDGFGVFNTNAPGAAVNVNILGCWVENYTRWFPSSGQTDGTHNDCVQIQGGSAIVIRGCLMSGYYDTGSGNTSGLNRQTPQFTTGNSCIQFNNNVGNTSNVLIEDNWFYGAEIGMNGGSLAAAVNLGIIRNNKFDHGQTANLAPGTNTTYTINISSTPTVTLTGNVYEDNGVAVQIRRP